MSVYKYCESCESPMDFPSATDCIIGTQLCSECQEPHGVDEFTRRSRIDELLYAALELLQALQQQEQSHE